MKEKNTVRRSPVGPDTRSIPSHQISPIAKLTAHTIGQKTERFGADIEGVSHGARRENRLETVPAVVVETLLLQSSVRAVGRLFDCVAIASVGRQLLNQAVS